MNAGFFQIIYNSPLITAKDLKEIIDAHKRVEFTKNSFFLRKGKMANDYYLIEEGLLRACVHDFKGNDITTDFYGPNDIAIEVSSLFQRITAKEDIMALTDGIAWKIEFKKFQELFHRIYGFREWGRAWMSEQLFIAKQRKIEMLTKKATERYKALIASKPEIVRYAPVKHIASYLGITDTSLSRIRKEILSD